MIRVMMLVPVLLITTYMVARARKKQVQKGQKFQKIAIPWFAIGFMGVIAFNSFDLLPAQLVAGINTLDTFLLTMAMTALGTETSIDKFRKAGGETFCPGISSLYLAGSRRLFPGEVSHSLFNVIKNGLT